LNYLTLCISLFCGIVVKTESNTLHKSRTEVCEDIAHEAIAQNVDPVLAVAVGWTESAFIRDVRSHKGAVGPMQVIPRFWCKEKPCDYIEAGIRALKFYTRKYGEQRGLCAYVSGKPCERATESASAYRSSVIMTAAKFAELYRQSCEGC
jgi:hypothetical protein